MEKCDAYATCIEMEQDNEKRNDEEESNPPTSADRKLHPDEQRRFRFDSIIQNYNITHIVGNIMYINSKLNSICTPQ